MREGWRTLTMAAVCTDGSIKTGPFGTTLKAAEYSAVGTPLISVGEIGIGEVRVQPKTPRVSPMTTDRLSEYVLRTNDIVFARKGSIDRSARIKEHEDGYFLGSDGIRVRLPSAVCAEFVAYQVLSSRVRSWLRQHAGGSTMPSLNQGILGRIELQLPDLDEQRRIAGVLGALDDLIETNERLADGSEALACAISSSSERQVELREIASSPKLRSEMPDGFVDHFSLPAFDAGRRPDAVAGADIKSNKLQIVGPTVIVSRLNPQTPRVWMVYPGSRKAYASTEFVPIAPQDGIAVEEVWPLCAAEGFSAQLRQHITGTTGSHQRVDKKILLDLVVPDPRGIRASDRTAVINLVREAHGSRSGAAQLRRTRDELLPLLMSGAVSPGEVAVAS